MNAQRLRDASCLRSGAAMAALVRPMAFTGRPLKGMVYVAPEGLRTHAALARWVRRGLDFVAGDGAAPTKGRR